MPFRLIAPVTQSFVLKETDAAFSQPGEEPTTIKVRQGAEGEHLSRARLFSDIVQQVSTENEIQYVMRFSSPEMERFDAYLTLSDCNIVGVDGKPLFRFKDGKIDMAQKTFNDSWGQLPSITAREIHRFVLEVNPDWRLPGSVEDKNSPLGEEL